MMAASVLQILVLTLLLALTLPGSWGLKACGSELTSLLVHHCGQMKRASAPGFDEETDSERTLDEDKQSRLEMLEQGNLLRPIDFLLFLL